MNAVSGTFNIVEVSLRAGLQSEPYTLSASDKTTPREKLVDAGRDLIKVGGFSSAEQYRQFANADQLFTKPGKERAFAYSALVADGSFDLEKITIKTGLLKPHLLDNLPATAFLTLRERCRSANCTYQPV